MPLTRSAWASDPDTEVPAAVRPPTPAEEGDLLRTFVRELNERHRALLGEAIECEREVPEEETVSDAQNTANTTYIFIGGGHAAKLYETMTARGHPTVLFRLRGMGDGEVHECAQQIRAMVTNMESTGGPYILVYTVLETLTYRDQDGNPAQRGAGGIEHIKGLVSLVEEEKISRDHRQAQTHPAGGRPRCEGDSGTAATIHRTAVLRYRITLH